jgi:peptidase E
MTGGSAGSLCWHTGGTTDSFGPELRPWTDGLGLVQGSTCPHYDSEARRRPLYQRLVREGALDPGVATDDGVGLHYVDGVLHEAVADRPGAFAWRVDREGETKLEPRVLASR